MNEAIIKNLFTMDLYVFITSCLSEKTNHFLRYDIRKQA